MKNKFVAKGQLPMTGKAQLPNKSVKIEKRELPNPGKAKLPPKEK